MNKNSQLSTWWDESRMGNVESFSCIHQELYAGLNHYLYRILRDEDNSQDILQDLFVKLWERKDTLDAIANISGYFYRSARCLAINFLKNKKNQTVEYTDEFDIDLEFSQEDIWMQREHTKEVSAYIAIALNALPKRQKEMIFLKYFNGLNYDQIAEITGINYQSVANHVHRGLIKLRLDLSENERPQLAS